jgi:hypothetical protein
MPRAVVMTGTVGSLVVGPSSRAVRDASKAIADPRSH